MQSKIGNASEDFLDYHENFSDEKLQKVYPKLRRYCQFLSQNRWDGEDLVQEALIKALHHYKHKPEITTALLNRIARNEWIDTVRKRGKESLEAIPEHAYDEPRQIDGRFEVVQKLMNKLTPKQALMFSLKEGFQFQLSEIAGLFDTTESAVKAIIFRAKQRIENQGPYVTNPHIEQYWTMDDYVQIEKALHESFKTQDPSILVKSIPKIGSLRKGSNFTCSMHKSRLFKIPSSTVYMAA